MRAKISLKITPIFLTGLKRSCLRSQFLSLKINKTLTSPFSIFQEALVIFLGWLSGEQLPSAAATAFNIDQTRTFAIKKIVNSFSPRGHQLTTPSPRLPPPFRRSCPCPFRVISGQFIFSGMTSSNTLFPLLSMPPQKMQKVCVSKMSYKMEAEKFHCYFCAQLIKNWVPFGGGIKIFFCCVKNEWIEASHIYGKKKFLNILPQNMNKRLSLCVSPRCCCFSWRRWWHPTSSSTGWKATSDNGHFCFFFSSPSLFVLQLPGICFTYFFAWKKSIFLQHMFPKMAAPFIPLFFLPLK